jgi:hypothetical protein
MVWELFTMSEPAQPVQKESSRLSQGSNVRFRLGALLAWMPAVAIIAMLCRNARPLKWFTSISVDFTRLLGFSAAILAILLGIGLVRQGLLLYERRCQGDGSTPVRALAWRIVVVSVLLTLVFEQSWLLGDKLTTLAPDESFVNMQRVLPLLSTIGLAGLVGALHHGKRRRRRKLVWLSVFWSVVAAVGIFATQCGVPYLVLIAMEAVRNAMIKPDVSQPLGPALHARLMQAGLTALPAFLSSLVVALLLSHELQRTPGEATIGESSKRPHTRLLLAMAVITGSLTGWVVFDTIPTLSRPLTEGLRELLKPRLVLALFLSFASLSVGFAARAADYRSQLQPEPTIPPSWRRYLAFPLKGFVALLLLEFIATEIVDMMSDLDSTWRDYVGWSTAALESVRSRLPDQLGMSFFTFPYDEPILIIVQLWITWRILIFLLVPMEKFPIPLDSIVESAPDLKRFLVRWFALTILLMASLPLLFVEGIVVFAYCLHPLG